MTVDEIIKWFGSGRKACLAIGISDRNLTRWRRQGYIPERPQLLFEKKTGGELLADEFVTEEVKK